MPMLPPRRLPLLPLLLRLAPHSRGRHTSAGGGARGLCAYVFHDYRAARASRLSRAFCGFRRATPRASPLDLTDEQSPGTAIRRSTAATSHFQIEESSCLIKLQWLAPAHSPPRPRSPVLPSRPSPLQHCPHRRLRRSPGQVSISAARSVTPGVATIYS